MKEILIKVQIDGEKIGTLIKTRGFDSTQTVSNSLEVIGILENIKQQELAKLQVSYRAGSKGVKDGLER